jgi:hypothetical protein
MNALVLWYFLAIGMGSFSPTGAVPTGIAQVGPFYNQSACQIAIAEVNRVGWETTRCFVNDAMPTPPVTPAAPKPVTPKKKK